MGQLQKLLGIEHLWRRGAVDIGNAILQVDRDAGLALAAFLGGDEHHAIAAVGTIDTGGGGIFQHGDALDVVGVEKRQRTDGIALAGHQIGGAAGKHRHAIDNPQRLAAGRKRTVAAHTDVEPRTGIVGRVAVDVDLHAGDKTVEHGVETTFGQVFQLLGTYLIGRPYKVAALLHRTVCADNHNILDSCSIVLHTDSRHRRTLNGNGLRLHAYIAERERNRQRSFNTDGIAAIHIGDGHLLGLCLGYSNAY